MYQPEDGAPGGLTISQQLEKEPFAEVLKLRPKHGMHVIHTSVNEVGRPRRRSPLRAILIDP